jgi:hypothetical protein
MGRRDALVLWLQCLLLALFPWMRGNAAAAGRVAEAMVPASVEHMGFEEILAMLRDDVRVVQGWEGNHNASPFDVRFDAVQGAYVFRRYGDDQHAGMYVLPDATLAIVIEHDQVRRKVVQRAMQLSWARSWRDGANGPSGPMGLVCT